MEPVQTTTSGICPPHHWVIGNEATEQGTVERWSCQRCSAVRERALARRRPLLDGSRRYIGGDGDPFGAAFGQSGERVA